MVEKTKEELSAEINKMLGTNIDFTKLSKEELSSLYEALQKLKEAQWPLPILDKPLGEILDRKILGKPLREVTLAELLGLPRERKGLLGFGIISRLMARAEEKRDESQS